MNYRDEKEHDRRLIGLIKELAQLRKLDLFSLSFGLSNSGKLEQIQRRKLFDLEITFTNFSCIIETKVDSDESGRWKRCYQTEQIVNNINSMHYLKPQKYFLFFTYGTSEYYTKPYKNGSASPDFKHISLDKIISFVESAIGLPITRKNEYEEWLLAMRVEQQKRIESINLLKAFSIFHQKYLNIHNDIDFPNNRLMFCAPEIAFPVLYRLAEFWNSDPYFYGKFGRVSVYPLKGITHLYMIQS